MTVTASSTPRMAAPAPAGPVDDQPPAPCPPPAVVPRRDAHLGMGADGFEPGVAVFTDTDRLTGVYCAERAAAALLRAEAVAGLPGAEHLLAAAHRWEELGVALATTTGLNRPRPRDDDGNGR